MDRTAITICKINIALNSLITTPISDEKLETLENEVISLIYKISGQRKRKSLINLKKPEIKDEEDIEEKSEKPQEQLNIPKKRGRKPKEIQTKTIEEQVLEEKPIKNKKEVQTKLIEKQIIQSTPKKRGRKPKKIDVTDNSKMIEESKAINLVKPNLLEFNNAAPKKRGRKPKLTETNKKQIFEDNPIPKKRGRKPKNIQIELIKEEKVAPKKRGRKPKNENKI